MKHKVLYILFAMLLALSLLKADQMDDFHPFGHSCYFDGTNDHIRVQYSTGMNLTSNMTVELWIYVTSFDRDWQAIVTKGDNTWRLHRDNDTGNITFVAGGSSVTTSGINFASGGWRHLAATKSGSTLRVYVNGELNNTATGASSTPTNTHYVQIGENAQATGRFFEGYMDEIRIWNYARTQNQIKANRFNHLSGSSNGLLVYYKFDNPDNWMESVTNNYHGIAMNMSGIFQYSNICFRSFGPGDYAHNYNDPSFSTVFAPLWSSATTQLTAEAWFNLTDIVATDRTVIYHGEMAEFHILTNGNVLTGKVRIWNGDSSPWYSYTYTGIAPGQWYHTSLSVNTQGLTAFYVNGALVGSNDFTGQTGLTVYDPTGDPVASIGSKEGTSQCFNGKIDEVRIWGTARTQTQIWDGRHQTLAGNETGLLAYYQFNEALEEGFGRVHYNLAGSINLVPSSALYRYVSNWPQNVYYYGGTLSQNTTLPLGEIQVWGDIIIPPNLKLEINTGTSINFLGHYGIRVEGSLQAIGAIGDSIRFTVVDTLGFYVPQGTSYSVSSAGGWNQIRIVSAADQDSTILHHCIFTNSKAIGIEYYDSVGGAVYIGSSSKFRISNSRISNNLARYRGGGICALGTGGGLIRDCIIKDNSTIHTQGLAVVSGGGISIVEGELSIINCQITNNYTWDSGGGIGFVSGLESGPAKIPLIKGNYIAHNHAGQAGGGIGLKWPEYMSPTIVGNEIAYNHSPFGGGILVDYLGDVDRNVLFESNILHHNTAEKGAAVAFNNSNNHHLKNNTIVSNTASVAGGAIHNEQNSGSSLYNCILWSNSAPAGNQVNIQSSISGSPMRFYNCDIEGGYAGFSGAGLLGESTHLVDCFDLDPEFGSVPGSPYITSDVSPCVNRGLENSSSYPTDFLGNPRILASPSNITAQIDAILNRVDVGAYESQVGFGIIPQDMTFSSNLTINVPIAVSKGYTLTVNPGVTLYCYPEAVISAFGSLQAVGTLNQKIVFAPQNPALGWGGLRFGNNTASADSSHLAYCIIRGGNDGSPLKPKGGNIYVQNYDKLFIYNSTIRDGYAAKGAGGYIESSASHFYGCMVHDNQASSSGGAFYVQDAAPVISNQTIILNSAPSGSAISAESSANCSLVNNIIWDNSANPVNGTMRVYYNNIEGGHGGSTNIALDPRFKGTGDHPYELLGHSPCLNWGVMDPFTYFLPEYDMQGNPRVYSHVMGIANRVDLGAYEYQGLMTISNFTASDGDNNHSGYVYLDWDFHPTYEPISGFRIYRNEVLIYTNSPDLTSYSDMNAMPGQFYNYTVNAYASTEQSAGISDVGYMKPNGTITGTIKTPNNNPVADVQVTISPFDGKSILMNDNSEVTIADPLIDTSASHTYELWMKTQEEESLLFIRGPIGLDMTGLGLMDGKLTYFEGIETMLQQSSQSPILTDNAWHHVALVYDASLQNLSLYIDAVVVLDTTFACQITSGDITIAGFTGNLDEFRIFNYARSQTELAAEMQIIMPFNKNGLIGYWSMNEGQGIKIFDGTNYNHIGTMTGVTWSDDNPGILPGAITDPWGEYTISQIFYGASTTFTLTPYKQSHFFHPEQRLVTLSTSNISQNGVDFTDNSMISISGRVMYQGTVVPVEGANILLNGESIIPPVQTTSDGYYTIDLEHGTNTTLSVSFNEHEFNRVWELGPVTYPQTGKNFLDISTSSFVLWVVGGPDSFQIGSFDVQMRSVCNRYYQEVIAQDLSWNSGVVAIMNVPPLDMFITAEPCNDEPMIDYFGLGTKQSYQDIKTVRADLRNAIEEPDTLRIEWRNDLTVNVAWPQTYPLQYFQSDTNEEYGFRVVEQNTWINLVVTAYEDYNFESYTNRKTYITDCDITFYDDIGPLGETEASFAGQNSYVYRFAPYLPNILSDGNRPYQNSLGVTVIDPIRNRQASNTDWAITVGARPMENTFATTSPEIPFLILHDPPGDASYSSFKETSSISSSIEFSVASTDIEENFYTIHMGPTINYNTGFFFSVQTEIENTDDLVFGLTTETRQQNDTSQTITLTTSQEYKTSDQEQLIGRESDLYIGGALNLIWGLTKELSWDEEDHEVVLEDNIMVSPDGFATVYIYTENQILLNVIPNLIAIEDTVSAQMWQGFVDMNSDNIANAVPNPNHPGNVSFNAGAGYMYDETNSVTNSHTFIFDTTVTDEWQLVLGTKINGMGTENGFRFATAITRSNTSVDENTNETSISYELADNDETSSLNYLADYFTVDIKKDPVYGTPVFDLLAGASSNRWEQNTMPRDGVSFSSNTQTVSGLQEDDEAVFLLYLGNTSQTMEDRRYYLTMHHESNPGGATVRINGVPLEAAMPIDILGGQQVQVVMTVSRGPIEHVYEDLQLELYAPGDRGNAGPDGHHFYMYRSFNVYWEEPYSKVRILSPSDDWIVNQTTEDIFFVNLGGYDLSKPSFESIKLQYKLRSDDVWLDAFEIERDLLVDYPFYYTYPWDLSDISDGLYEIRACAVDSLLDDYYTEPLRGVIDRTSPEVFGTPQPSTGVLTLGGEISISFTEEIDPVVLNPDLISLRILATNHEVAVDYSCFENKLILLPNSAFLYYMENNLVEAKVDGIRDKYGNPLGEEVSWEFLVNSNPVYWVEPRLELIKPLGQTQAVSTQLINSGGQASSFTLTGLPDWLTANVSDGTLQPLDYQTISFTISEQLGYGVHRCTVYADIPALGLEPLLFEISVLANPPTWATAQLDIYEYSMTITGQLNMEGTLSTDTDDIIGAFVQNGNDYVCRGIAGIRSVPFGTTPYQFFLTVFSDSEDGEEIVFRVWDSSENKEHNGIEEEFLFISGAVYGTPLVPLECHVLPELFSEINCRGGWNWISVNLANQTSMNVNTLLSSLDPGPNDIIKNQTGFAQYTPGLGWVGSLQEVQTTESLKLKLAQPDMLHLTGFLEDPANTTIDHGSGWNWIGYLPHISISVNDALADMSDPETGDIVKNQQGYAQYIEGYGWWGSLLFMDPGKGYMLKTANTGSFTYPDYVIPRGEQDPPFDLASLDRLLDLTEWEVNPLDYEYSSTITAVIMSSGELLNSNDILLGAFYGDECRGIAVPVRILDQWVFFLTQYSNVSNQTLSYKVYLADSDEVIDIEESLPFINNQVLGNPLDPFVFNISQALASPLNVVLELNGNTLTISWDSVAAATSYQVLASDDPYGVYTDVTASGTLVRDLDREAFRSATLLGTADMDYRSRVYWSCLIPDARQRFYKVITVKDTRAR